MKTYDLGGHRLFLNKACFRRRRHKY